MEEHGAHYQELATLNAKRAAVYSEMGELKCALKTPSKSQPAENKSAKPPVHFHRSPEWMAAMCAATAAKAAQRGKAQPAAKQHARARGRRSRCLQDSPG
jgi:hypothetical protein